MKTVPVDISDALDDVRRIQGEPVEKLEAIPLRDDSGKMSKLV